MQFQELADRWLADLRERVELGDLKPASLATFASRVKHVLPALGQHEVENDPQRVLHGDTTSVRDKASIRQSDGGAAPAAAAACETCRLS